MAVPTPRSGPTVLRILLGSQLRRLREAAGLSRADAGFTIRASESKMSRLESGRVSFKQRDVDDLLILYGVKDSGEREAFVALARQANEPGWWHQYSDVLPSWFQAYVGLEEAAVLVRTYEVQFVPGLLQTEEYARAAIAVGQPGASPDEIERRVSLRMARQQALARPNGPQLWTVVDEAALQRTLGDPDVMRAQIEWLIAMTKLPNVTLQVLPFGAGGHPAEGQSFVMLRFGDPDLPDVAYLEQLRSALYLEKREDVDHYAGVMDRLSVQAYDPERSIEFLTKMLEPGRS